MKTTVYELTGPESLVAKSVDLDESSVAPNQIFAATEFSAVSTGTELAAWRGDPPLRPSRVYPRLVGYCNVAKVLRTGADVKDIRPGDYILTHQAHRSHFICSRSEVLLVCDTDSAELRRRLTTIYLFHLGYVSLLAGNFFPGHDVAVIGLGALGYTAAALARAFGADPILFSDHHQGIAKAALVGARVHSKRASESERKTLWTSCDGADLVINTSNTWPDYLLSLQVARKGGTVVLLGFPGRGAPHAPFNPLDSQYLYDNQLTLRQAGYVSELDVPPIDARFTLSRNVKYLHSLIERGMLNVDPLIAYRAKSSELAVAYARLQARSVDSLSALLEWQC